MQLICYKELVLQAKQLAPVETLVVHPVTPEALGGAIAAFQEGLIIPILIGPISKITVAAQTLKVNLSQFEIIATEHSHAAAEQAIALIRLGKGSMLMKGSLHTDELMHIVLDKEQGLRTAKRMSHAFVIEIETYDKFLILTDCALNIQPSLMEKKDIVQNAIELAKALGINLPKVAILSAVETINDKLQSTLDAAALCKMAERKQIVGGLLDGPLAFDNAVSKQAAKVKEIESDVAGDADILLAPDLESGNMLAKQLHYLANARLAGLVLGARIPIVLTSRADNADARVTSCALGILYKHYLEQQEKLCP